MATLWIEEEPDIPQKAVGILPVHDATLGNNIQQKITIAATSAESEHAFGNNTKFITIHADAECYFEIGKVGETTATTDSRNLVADVYRTFKVKPGWTIAVKDTT